jgi:putative tryptophan/tyrosine transport system substrate-binding protein
MKPAAPTNDRHPEVRPSWRASKNDRPPPLLLAPPAAIAGPSPFEARPAKEAGLAPQGDGSWIGAAVIRRRTFLSLLGGAAAAWPRAARAQQGERMRRIGVVMGFAENDRDWQARVTALRAALQELGWTDGRNVRFDVRWTSPNPDRVRAIAAELVAQAPDVLFGCPHFAVAAMHRETRAVPIVAVQSGDLVSAGLAQSLARPGGNVTGFISFEATINTKLLQLLKDIAPQVNRVAVMQGQSSAWRGDFAAIEAVARSIRVQPIQILARDDAADIEGAITAFAREPHGGMILPPDNTTIRHRELIIALAAKHRLPVVYALWEFVAAGGLMFYGADFTDIFRRAASYVDRILRGAKPADLPVQAPTKFELVINLKTAKALGLEVPTTLLARADEVIE